MMIEENADGTWSLYHYGRRHLHTLTSRDAAVMMGRRYGYTGV